MSEQKDTAIALNVRLKPSDSSAHPRVANYTHVGVAQGIVYLDFGFIEPALLAPLPRQRRTARQRRKDETATSGVWVAWRSTLSRRLSRVGLSGACVDRARI